MKKVLIVTTLKRTIEGFLIPHIKLLEELGYQVDLACNMEGKSPIKELHKNRWYHFNFTRNPFSISNLKSTSKLRGLIKKQDYHMIHLHTPIASFLGRLAASTLKMKNIIYTAHGFHFYKGAPLINWMVYYPAEWLAMRWTDKIITINQEDYERAHRMAGKRTKVYKINGVGLDLQKYSQGRREKIRKELKLSEEDFLITIIGELNKNKNQIQLIKAIEILDGRFKALIVGKGIKEKELKEYVKIKKMENRVIFLGHRNDIGDIIAASDTLTSMSHREGLPRSIMEGMAQGKPFIVTNIRGNRDIIKNGVNGFLTDVNRYDLTAQNIKKLEDKKVLNAIKIINLRDVEKYSIERILKKIKKLYLGR